MKLNTGYKITLILVQFCCIKLSAVSLLTPRQLLELLLLAFI